WWSGLPQGSPDFFARQVQVSSRNILFHKKSSRKGCSERSALTKWAALPGWFKAKRCFMECPRMAKQCTACNRFYLATLDSCPSCGNPAYEPADEPWPAIKSSGRLPAPHTPLESLAPAELSAGPDADSSPL